jgi:hypothetical protein
MIGSQGFFSRIRETKTTKNFFFYPFFYSVDMFDGSLSDLNSPCKRVHSYLHVSPDMQKYIENVRARHVHAYERNKPPWLEGRRPYVRCLYMYACVQRELAMVYVYQAIIL